MIRELVWAGRVRDIQKKTGLPLVRLQEQGVADILAHVRVTGMTEVGLRECARSEGRTGWSSALFAIELAHYIESEIERGRTKTQEGRVNLAVSCEDAAQMLDRMLKRMQLRAHTSEGVIQLGHDRALDILKWLHPEPDQSVLLGASQKGMDVRWGSMRNLAKFFGDFSGLGVPDILRYGQFSPRNSPDDRAMRHADRLEKSLEEFRLTLPTTDEWRSIEIGTTGPVLVRPRGSKYTGVLVSIKLPGMDTLYAAWNAEVDS